MIQQVIGVIFLWGQFSAGGGCFQQENLLWGGKLTGMNFQRETIFKRIYQNSDTKLILFYLLSFANSTFEDIPGK